MPRNIENWPPVRPVVDPNRQLATSPDRDTLLIYFARSIAEWNNSEAEQDGWRLDWRGGVLTLALTAGSRFADRAEAEAHLRACSTAGSFYHLAAVSLLELADALDCAAKSQS